MILSLTFALSHAADDPAPAEKKKDDGPKVKVSGLLFPSYGFDLTEGADGYNEFDIDRSYLRADAKLTDVLSVRLTLDANRQTGGTYSSSILPGWSPLKSPGVTISSAAATEA